MVYSASAEIYALQRKSMAGKVGAQKDKLLVLLLLLALAGERQQENKERLS